MWRGTFKLSWCDLCECASIICPDCKLGSCSAGSCEKCHDAFTEFLEQQITVESYLSPEEAEIYRKGIKLKQLIFDSLGRGETQIDWKVLHERGELSRHDEKVFAKELRAVDLNS